MTEAKKRRIRLTIEYDGTDFVGWQRQRSGASIQAELENAILKMTGEKVFVRAAGRTDAGVHALGQAGHFDTHCAIADSKFHTGLNFFLPPAIAILSAQEVPLTFDARLSARGKLYRYQIIDRSSRSAVFRHCAWHVHTPLDSDGMDRAAKQLIGQHDFAAFRAADCDRDNTIRRIQSLRVFRQNNLLLIEVHGDAFLKYMIRILVGTLTEIGLGKRDPETIVQLLASPDRKLAGVTAPPHGLFLAEVYYPDF